MGAKFHTFWYVGSYGRRSHLFQISNRLLEGFRAAGAVPKIWCFALTLIVASPIVFYVSNCVAKKLHLLTDRRH